MKTENIDVEKLAIIIYIAVCAYYAGKLIGASEQRRQDRINNMENEIIDIKAKGDEENADN